jgi:hypothetical protein
MKKIIAAICVFSSSIYYGQIKQEVKVEPFSKIKAGSALKVIVSLGNQESVVFEAEEEVLKKMRAEVKGGELQLSIEGKCNSEKDILVYVTAKSLKEVEADGAASVEIKDELKGDKLKMEAKGAAKITAQINTKELLAEVSGAGYIKIKGEAVKLSADVSGAGNLKADDLKAKEVEVHANGAGKASVNASDNLKASASGAGNIYYTGDPKNKELDAKSAGHISKG